MSERFRNSIEFKSTEALAMTLFDEICPHGEFDFNTLIPSPDHIKGTDQETKWNTLHWNTKWNAYHTSMEWRDGTAKLEFSTANGSPFAVFAAFGKRYKIDFTVKYLQELPGGGAVDSYKVAPDGSVKVISSIVLGEDGKPRV